MSGMRPARVKAKGSGRPPDREPFAVGGAQAPLLDPLPASPAGSRSRSEDGEHAGDVHCAENAMKLACLCGVELRSSSSQPFQQNVVRRRPTRLSSAKILLQPALLRADGSRHRFLWPAESFAAPVTEARRAGVYHRPSAKASCSARE